MNKDIRAAMLGDHEAAKRLTETGVRIPCPGCGGSRTELINSEYIDGQYCLCDACGWIGPTGKDEYEARLAWNTRAPILSAEEMEMLEGME